MPEQAKKMVLTLVYGVAMLLVVVGAIGTSVSFLYVEWLYIRESFVQVFNPLLHFAVFFSLLQMPLFWVFVACGAGGLLVANWIDPDLEL